MVRAGRVAVGFSADVSVGVGVGGATGISVGMEGVSLAGLVDVGRSLGWLISISVAEGWIDPSDDLKVHEVNNKIKRISDSFIYSSGFACGSFDLRFLQMDPNLGG